MIYYLVVAPPKFTYCRRTPSHNMKFPPELQREGENGLLGNCLQPWRHARVSYLSTKFPPIVERQASSVKREDTMKRFVGGMGKANMGRGH